MAKDFKYRGHTLEELQKMSIDDFAKLLKARERRSLLRIKQWEETRFNKKEYMIKSNEIIKFYNKAKKVSESIKNGEKQKRPLRTHRREVIILPYMVGLSVEVYNGKEFRKIDITPEMIGHRLGEFVLTRKEVIHKGIGKKK